MPSIPTVAAQAMHTAATVLRNEALEDGLVFRELWSRVLAKDSRLAQDRKDAVAGSPQPVTTPFKDYVNWAAVNLVKAGWLYRGNRRWQLTGLGADALDHWPDPVDFSLEAGRRGGGNSSGTRL